MGGWGGSHLNIPSSLHHYFYQQRYCQLGREVSKNIKQSINEIVKSSVSGHTGLVSDKRASGCLWTHMFKRKAELQIEIWEFSMKSTG